ncbi:ParB family protein [Pantoea sp. BAV 3049]|uniref:ParB family protein n=1 Tax=Pantoea sp. BAV 3049 TaxID=2654188 RepID=UPI00131DCADB|nr:ParB family protein [Pantoea sp. BAV 3049]
MGMKRKTIGRTFVSPSIQEQLQEESKRVFTLSSGRKVLFTKLSVPADEVESGTYVVQDINGREQSGLTPESLKDITRTLSLQQFFPVIGVRNENGINILDGSRRRASAILTGVGLDVLATDEELTATEAKDLAKDIQTAREHNLREVGMRLLALKNSGLSQKEIAEDENLSQAKVTRALQAASVSADMLAVFPVQSELTYPDYKTLLVAEELLKEKGILLREFIADISTMLGEVWNNPSLAEDEVKDKIVAIVKSEAALTAQKTTGEKVTVTSLWEFTDKNRYARKKSRGRMFSYEFNRMPAELQESVDAAVQRVLSEYLENE